MAGTVTFILKNKKSKDETPINLVFWYDQLRMKLSTGERIKPKYWNKKTRRAKETKDFPEFENFNTRLDNHERNVMSAVRDHLNENNTILPLILRAELVNLLRPKPEPKPEPEPEKITFFQAIQEYIDITNKAPRTKISYSNTLSTLTKFNSTLKQDLTFESINMDFYEDFTTYLTYVLNYSKNTIGTRIKNVKTFMNYALEKGYTNNRGHLHKNFKKVEETAETIYLTDSELITIYEKDFSNNARLDRVRDLFIIGCYTGLRFSDLSQLTPEKFTEDGTRLKIKTIKTGEIVVIPLHWTIKEILKKYNGETPRALSNQKMNEYIKELAELAKIKERVTITKTKGGLNFEKTFKKWELITVHTARRSFATNMFLAGVPTISIMKITGHRTERAFMKYIKVSQEQNADILSKHPYFSKSPLKVVNN